METGSGKSEKSTRGVYKRKLAKKSTYGQSYRPAKARKTIAPLNRSMSYYGGPFPPTFRTRVSYGTSFQLVATTGTVANQIFAMNGLYDVDLTSVGHQPRYFDTLCGAGGTAAPYKNYSVHSCSIVVSSCVVSPDAAGVVSILAITPSTDATNWPTSSAEMLERRECKTKQVGYYGGGQNIMTGLRHFRKIKDMYGDISVDEANLKGAYNTNPNTVPVFHVSAIPVYGTNTVTYHLTAKLTFDVTFYFFNDVVDS